MSCLIWFLRCLHECDFHCGDKEKELKAGGRAKCRANSFCWTDGSAFEVVQCVLLKGLKNMTEMTMSALDTCRKLLCGFGVCCKALSADCH